MNEEQKFLLEKNLSRFDAYINAVNTKAAFLVSFNTFVLGTLLLKHDVILAQYSIQAFNSLGRVLFVICMLSIAWAIVNSFRATSPFLKESTTTNEQRTLLFFNSVARLGKDAYAERIKQISESELVDDLIGQTHVLAIGAKGKFEKISNASNVTLFGTTLALFLTASLRFIDWINK